ncbi:TetR/AcrR family transcriptional regulator C-terminal domain-containing protein [Nocardia asteroides]|uniref:TetR/AcrR family transcriptional regulator C-terminal domain-containing protein n=1 Tax=Nocardia asteroides TaxID=1824 RepID=UPI001E5AB92C|nr:TetR/AcrR family transcriptional regulator C-terminal domain-containing protein [Nocardia asteroides]UGT63458.1 TetR/AcrR family transcriptional regulator C-terminal domain-containing protein [Nocardia asteroides]
MAEPTAEERAARLIALLWRRHLPPRPPTRGPRQTVNVDAVVEAAVALADRDGLAGVSIRAVATELGLRPMSLYTYVPGKDELLAAMVDELAARDGPLPGGAPRERVAAVARQVRAELLAHPWLLEVSPWRLVLGPGRLRRYDRQLAALTGLGLDDVALDRAVRVLTEFATGNAGTAVAARRAGDNAAWWAAHGPLLAAVMPEREFPTAARVGAAVGERYQAPGDPDGDFEYGLGALIDGILLSGKPVGAART